MSPRDDAQAKTNAEGKDHTCPYCSRAYKTRERLVHHSVQAHGKRPMDPKRLAIGALIVVLVVAGIVAGAYARNQSLNPGTREGNLEVFDVTEADPRMGNADAPVVVVAFESPVCSGCKWFHENMLPRLERDYFSGQEVVFYYQHFDTYGRSGHATLERTLSLSQDCVHREGGDAPFWNWTRFLYAEQFGVTLRNLDDNLRSFADAEGLDGDAIVACTHDAAPTDEVEADAAVAHKKGVRGTPSFFVFGPEGDAEQVTSNGLEEAIQRRVADL